MICAYHLRKLVPVFGDLLHPLADKLRFFGMFVLDGAGFTLKGRDASLDSYEVALHARQAALERHHT